MENILTVGEWRESLDVGELGMVEEVEQRQKSGFRLLPYQSTVSRLIDLLDGYDYITSTFLMEE